MNEDELLLQGLIILFDSRPFYFISIGILIYSIFSGLAKLTKHKEKKEE